jgi:cytochrome c-type biogenesis protein CcmH
VNLRLVVAAMLAAFLGCAAALTPQDGTLTPEQDARYRTLIHELRCLVCQNQTIADSDAELAADLRNQVHDHIAAGASDDDIRKYVTDRYGDFVLYKPPLTGRTALLWVGPFGLALAGVWLVLRMLRRARAAPASTASTPADADRLRHLLDEEEGRR